MNQILQELVRRQAPKVDFLKGTFPEQAAFLRDPSLYKAAHCARGAAKSYTAGLGIYDFMQRYPSCSCFYVTKTRDMSRNIMWKTVMKQIDTDFNVGIEFNESLLEGRHPNGSTFRLIGIDGDSKQQHKLLGGKYKLVVLDEVAFFDTDLSEIINKVLIPAAGRILGSIWMMSTSSDYTRGLFFDVTQEDVSKRTTGWSVHEWSWKDNVYVRDAMQQTHDTIVANNPLIVNTAHFKQHWYNKWEINEEKRVYHYTPELNTISMLPQMGQPYNYVLGLDFGWRDDTAFTVLAYHRYAPAVYLVECYKAPKMDFFDVAKKIEELDKKYDFEVKIADGAAKQGIETLNNRFYTNLICAEKPAKQDYIAILNSELITGKIKVLPAGMAIADEWLRLVWKDKGAQGREEHPDMPNHLADSFLYSFRYCHNYLSIEETIALKPYTPEWYKQEEQKYLDKRMDKVAGKKDQYGLKRLRDD